jgi:hypothetical protein
MGRRRAIGSSLLAAGLLSACGGPPAGVAASCVGPQLTLTPAEGTPGTPVTAAFEWLHEGCNDYSGADEERPLVDVPVTFVQGGLEVPLGTVTGSGERWADALAFGVPDAALPGPAEIRLDGSAAGATPFTVLPPG